MRIKRKVKMYVMTVYSDNTATIQLFYKVKERGKACAKIICLIVFTILSVVLKYYFSLKDTEAS